MQTSATSKRGAALNDTTKGSIGLVEAVSRAYRLFPAAMKEVRKYLLKNREKSLCHLKGEPVLTEAEKVFLMNLGIISYARVPGKQGVVMVGWAGVIHAFDKFDADGNLIGMSYNIERESASPPSSRRNGPPSRKGGVPSLKRKLQEVVDGDRSMTPADQRALLAEEDWDDDVTQVMHVDEVHHLISQSS